jgi:hypothetical protein
MDKGEHTDIFEPIQLALDSPSGAERAMQRVQAAIEANPTEHITLHIDCINAFNTVDRAALLSAVYSDQRLSSSWHVFAFAYGNPSSLLVRDHGHVAGTIPSGRGVKQGCVLGSLGFARVMQPAYEACVAGLAVSAVAIMDDFTVTGPPAAVFQVYDRFVDLVRPLGIQVNTSKTKIQQAAGEPSEQTAQLIDEEVRSIVTKGYDRAKQLLTEHIDQLHAIAGALLEYETLTGDEIKKVMDGGSVDRGSATTTPVARPASGASAIPKAGRRGTGLGEAPAGA